MADLLPFWHNVKKAARSHGLLQDITRRGRGGGGGEGHLALQITLTDSTTRRDEEGGWSVGRSVRPTTGPHSGLATSSAVQCSASDV